MNLYNLKKISENFQSHPYFKDKISPKEFANMISEHFLIDHLNVRKIYAATNEVAHYYSTEEDVLLLQKYLEIKYPYKFDLLKRAKAVVLDDDFVALKFETETELKAKKLELIMSDKIQALVKKKVEVKDSKKMINQDFAKNIGNIQMDLNSDKIISVHFEYKRNKTEFCYSCYTMGITVSENGKTKTSNYVIKDHCDSLGMNVSNLINNCFNFGKSELINSSDIKNIVKEASQNSDFILFSEFGMSVMFLRKHGFELAENNLQAISVQYMSENFDYISNKKMISLLNKFKIASSKLWNAGNNSFYTFELMKAMKEKYKIKQAA